MGYFNNKTIWITGASSGIGRSLTVQLAKLGAKLVITARRKEELENVKLECGNADVHIYPFDLSDLDKIDQFSHSVQEEVGDIDILINNAGISAWSSINDTKFKVYQDDNRNGMEEPVAWKRLWQFQLKMASSALPREQPCLPMLRAKT